MKIKVKTLKRLEKIVNIGTLVSAANTFYGIISFDMDWVRYSAPWLIFSILTKTCILAVEDEFLEGYKLAGIRRKMNLLEKSHNCDIMPDKSYYNVRDRLRREECNLREGIENREEKWDRGDYDERDISSGL